MLRSRGMILTGAAALLLTPSCFKEDEELQRQLIELRASLDAKTKAAEEADSKVSELQGKLQRTGGGASSEELSKAKATIAELTKQLEAAKAAAGSGGSPFKIDMDAMASKLEEDLTRKAKQLRELVQGQIPSGRIDEISLKSIDYPPQLVTPFSSAITFNVLTDGGQNLRLMFPVTADLGGSWKLPTVADVQTAYKLAKETPLVAAAPTPAPAPAPGPGGAAPTPQPQAQPQPQAGGGGGMRQIDANTFAFDWGDGASGGARPAQPQVQAPAPQPQAPQQPPGVMSNFTPPAPGGAAPGPAPSPAPGAAPAAPPAAPSVPPPVMPTAGPDKIIRFD